MLHRAFGALALSCAVWVNTSAFAVGFGEFGETNIFGVDNREKVTSEKSPWRQIGYINTGCTGTLVSPDLVVTAAHCVIDPKTEKLRTDLSTFYPNRIDGSAKDSSYINHVWWGTSKPDSYRSEDWAILRLSKRLGDTYGWMGTRSQLTSTVTLVGYHGDFESGRTAGAHRGCTLREQVGGLLLHDCDTTRGSSGGPMFTMVGDAPYIVALNVAEYRNGGEVSLKFAEYARANANIAIPASTFLPKLKELLK